MKKRGFTLIELIAVLGIISLVSAIAIMRFNIIDNFKANIELQTLINDCDFAKMKAISTGEDYLLIFDKNSYSVLGSSKYLNDAEIERNLNNIYFSSYDSEKKIRFNKTGTVTYPGTIKINVPKGADDDKLVELRVRVGLGYVRYKK